MRIEVYKKIPQSARNIREEVFISEQGFKKEFDDLDAVSAHFVLYDGETPVGTCRVFWDNTMDSHVLGRLAVLKEYRGKNIGKAIVQEAESYVRKNGGKELLLHAQCRITGFYKKLGFAEFGEVDDDEGCPHIWMKKALTEI